MARVYSARLFGKAGITTPQSVTVPTGFLWVVRDIAILYGGSGSTVAVIAIAGIGEIYDVVVSNTLFYQQWHGHQVLNAGEQLEIVCTGPADILVSGYQLSTP